MPDARKPNNCPICHHHPKLERWGGWYRTLCPHHSPPIHTPWVITRQRSYDFWNRLLITTMDSQEITIRRHHLGGRGTKKPFPPFPASIPGQITVPDSNACIPTAS